MGRSRQRVCVRCEHSMVLRCFTDILTLPAWFDAAQASI